VAFVHDVAHYRREVHTRFVTEMHDQGASGGADAEGSITCAAVDGSTTASRSESLTRTSGVGPRRVNGGGLTPSASGRRRPGDMMDVRWTV
jgi:hypothetical protein